MPSLKGITIFFPKHSLAKSVMLIMLLIMLPACASTRMAQQLQSAKISFEDGSYKSAFHKLLPLASEGSPEAEYAVGYMYYFGYGTAQDAETGLFWMNKAAEQHYAPAIKAVDAIRHNKISEEPTQQLQLTQSTNTRVSPVEMEESDAVLDALTHTLKPAEPEVVAVETHAVPKSADFNEEHKKRYTLQLMGSSDMADIKRARDRLRIGDKSYCAQITRDGHDWYVLGYGEYPAPYLAKLAMDDLPPHIRELKPWVREIGNAKQLA